MKVASLLEQDEWQSAAPLSDDDPKSAKLAHRKAVSLTNQLNIIHDQLNKYLKDGTLVLVHSLATIDPSSIDRMKALPPSKGLGRLYIKPDTDQTARTRIAHLVGKYDRIHELHRAATDESLRLTRLRNTKKSEKRELNKLTREHTRELERAKKWERR